MPVEKCVRQSSRRPRTFSELPLDVLALVAGKLCPGSSRVARLVCKDLNDAVMENMAEMDLRLFLSHASSDRLGPEISVRRENVTATMLKGGTEEPPRGCCRTRAEALVELFGITVIPQDADADSPTFDLGTWVHVTADRWRMAGLDIVDPRGRQLARFPPCLRGEVESLSVRATSTRSSKRGQALAASLLSGGKLRRLRMSVPEWPGSGFFSSLRLCRGLASLEIVSRKRDSDDAVCGGVAAVASCGTLERLRLRWSGRGDAAFRSLCLAFSARAADEGLPALRELDVDCDLRDGSSLERIADCFPALERFSGRRIECSSAGIEALSRLKSLASLELCGSMATASPPPGVGRFPSLREARVSGCGATEDELNWLSGARGLEILDASDNNLRTPPALHPDARIDRLDLSWNYLGYGSAEALTGPVYSRLRFMDVSNNDLLDYGAVAIARSVGPGRSLSAVETLSVHHNRLSYSGARFIESDVMSRLVPAGVKVDLIGRAGVRERA